MASEFVLGNSLLLRQRAAFGIEYMVQEHERDMGPWTAEWETISEMFQLSSGLLHHIKGILLGLKVNEVVMADNLNKSNQLIMAEAVMMKLAEKVGRQEAHDIVYRISMKTFEEGKMFSNALKDDEVIKSLFTNDDIDRILNPINYVGLSQKFVEDVVSKIRGFDGESSLVKNSL
ncbi:hypothetical protein [Bacillus sp. 1P02SD]|uniref:hypothetical protein n=1 Tax=Bacillus sp. 1P02SD TaxID=3132264 RepID=UPI00399FF8DD